MELNPPEAARNLQVPAEREDPPLINLDTTILEDLELAPPMVPLRAEGDVVPPVPLRAEGDVVPPVPPPVMVGNPVPPSSLGAIPRIVSAGPTSGRPLESQLDALKQKNAGESAEIPNPSYENALHLFYYTNKQIEYKKHEVGQYAYETSLVKSLELCKMELVKSLVQPIKERYTPFSVLPRCISNELPRIVEMLTEDLKHNRSQQLGLVKVATDYVTMLAQHEPDTMIRIVDAVKPRVKVMRSQVFTKNPQLNMAILMLLKALLTNTSICHALLPNIEISTLMMQSLMWATEQKSEEAFEAGAEILASFVSLVQHDDLLLETFVHNHFLEVLNRIIALYSHSDSSSYQKLLASLLHLLDTEKRFGPERTRREDVVENLTEYLSSATLLEKDEVSKNLSKLIFSTRSDKGWPDFIKSLRELEGGSEGNLLYARSPSRVTKSPGRSPGSQKKAMEIFPEPGPSSSRTPQRKLRVESEEEEEEEKKEVKRYNRAAKKSPGRLPPIFVDSASEEESEGEDEEAASAKSRRRSRSLTRASKKTGATTRAASASSSRYKVVQPDEERKKKEKRKKPMAKKSPGRQPPIFNESELEEHSYDEEDEEEAHAFATANRLTRRRSRSADRAPTGRVNTSRARAASASSSRQHVNKARFHRADSEKEKNKGLHSPPPSPRSVQKLLDKIPKKFYTKTKDVPHKVAVKALPFIFTGDELLRGIFPPVVKWGGKTERKPFPSVKVEAVKAVVAKVFPDVNPNTYMDDVRKAVNQACRDEKKRWLQAQQEEEDSD